MTKITKKAIYEFEKYLEEQEKSRATCEKYIRDIKHFADWLGGMPVEKLTLLKYKEHITDNLAPSSVNSVISSLNSFFKFNNWHFLKIKPLKIQRQIFLSESKELTKSEYIRLISAAKTKGNMRAYMLMQTICSTGIRISELPYITVKAAKQGKATVNLKGKMRVIIIPDQLCKQLIKYAKKQKIKSGSIFVTKSGKPLDRSNVWRVMKKLCNAARVDKSKVFPHNLRHLFARTFYQIQKDIVRLADILGHSNINTTRIYTMETGRIHRQKIQELGLLKC